ncbi:cellulose binding domain-containing protein [Micromonospora sp. KC213]|uniref:cellulose binding domain-containing protein n=1 Tax=Micromonospora sp. KC213 TaxID=2530378 RepID=UPI0010436322|nr:cellulose binding domain-containing protein [Micromonospora sp. KC213]TDC37250.1 cellulose-binding protein [Micromonospora sp. KC213]
MAWSPWVVVVAGVMALLSLQVVALLSVPGGERFHTRPPEPMQTIPLPDLPPPSVPTRVAATLPLQPLPGITPRRTEPSVGGGGTGIQTPPAGGGGQPGSVPPPVAPAPSTKPPANPSTPGYPPPAPAPSVTGRYSKLNDYGGAFIGEVLLTNTTSGARSWTVRLVLPQGRLVTAWVEGAPQGSARMSGGVFTYTSGVNLEAHATVPLRFHFEHTGGNNRPSSCTVNGVACSGR